jgi:NAD(P)-dependent dehydrogenase (short-subunit alcohol dehydrogenase family)
MIRYQTPLAKGRAMKIGGSVALVTGANRGLGRAYARELVKRGAAKVLADERTRTVKAQLSRDHELIYPPVQEFWDAAVGGTS